MGANIAPVTPSFCIPQQMLLSREDFQSQKRNDKVAPVQVVKPKWEGGGEGEGVEV
jgi:hypothetical protein